MTTLPETRSIRDSRRAARSLRPGDPLAERARKLALWQSSPWRGSWQTQCLSPIYRHPSFRRLVLPGVRAYLNARERARREQIAAEARDFDERRRAEKAAKARAAAPQTELF